MSDDDKKFRIEVSPQAQAKVDSDPALAEVMREMMKSFDAAMEALATGKFETFEDAMEAITGQRPKPLSFDEGQAQLFEVTSPKRPERDEDDVIHCSYVEIGACHNPMCHSVHFGLMDDDDELVAQATMPIDAVPEFIERLEGLVRHIREMKDIDEPPKVLS